MDLMRPRRLSALAAPVAVLAISLLAGCAPSVEQPEPTTSPAPTTTTTPSASATPTPTPTPEIIPLTIGCDQLLAPDALYEFDPNFSYIGSFVPAAGTPAARAVAAGGVACRWVHDTNGTTLDVSAAELPESVSTALKNDLVVSSNSVPTYGVEGYFMLAGGAGQAEAFPDPYWVTIVSPALYEPGDAAALMAAVIGALG